MKTRIPFGTLSYQLRLRLTPEAIRKARSRATKAGKPDPFPWVLNRGPGRPAPLADLPTYNEAARREGWPLWPLPKEMEGGGTR
jgi:hypothetical protein